MIKKNEIYEVEIIDQGFEGEGIAKIDDITVFIEGAIQGEIVKISIVKVLSSFAYGKILEIIKKSDNREEVDCSTYNKCGGCQLRHIKYEETLKIKTNIVKNCLYKLLHKEIQVEDCIGMKEPINYRNKLIYPVGTNKQGKPVMGVFAKRSHNIIETTCCYIQDKNNERIAKGVFEILIKQGVTPYNEETKQGIIRHIIIRNGKNTGQIMIILVCNNSKIPNSKGIVEELIKRFPEITTIIQNINTKNTNVILGDTNKVLYGTGYIYDKLGEYEFKISTHSFYQVNPVQTEILYNTAIQYAQLTGKETIFDLYCGIGTIAIFASKKANQVYAIEVVAPAIEDAKENAKLNNVSNCEFIVGETETILPVLVEKHKADVVFVDPPRKGCDKTVLDTLLKIEPKKIVYISCNPATLARDIVILEEKYNIEKVEPVDMFPYTSHIECVSVLELKKN